MNSAAAIILLAGGLGSRLGANKPLQRVAGKPLIAHVIERVSGLSDEFVVVIARDVSRTDYLHALPGFVRVINDEPQGKSPLIGIVTALRNIKSQYAVVLTCDIPFVNRLVIHLLLERVLEADAAVPRWESGRLEPLQAAYRRESVLFEAEEALSEGCLSPAQVINRLAKVSYVSVEDEIKRLDPNLGTFFNVNTKEDVAKAEIMLREKIEAGKL
jgi:molybdopterin-guanine dinucleotide biosynthesis protein A